LAKRKPKYNPKPNTLVPRIGFSKRGGYFYKPFVTFWEDFFKFITPKPLSGLNPPFLPPRKKPFPPVATPKGENWGQIFWGEKGPPPN